jgi:GGDEF domain-containing protein
MPTDPYHDAGSRVVTIEAFDFIFRNELKRAVRAQNFLTLLLLQTSPLELPARSAVVSQLARLVSLDVRETDLVAEGEAGRVWALLLDTDLESSMHVIDRLLARLRHYEFASPVGIDIGAASCPLHGTDADTLRRAAESGWSDGDSVRFRS